MKFNFNDEVDFKRSWLFYFMLKNFNIWFAFVKNFIIIYYTFYSNMKKTMTEFIKNLRIEKWVSQQELADLLGVTRQTYSKLENWKIDPTLWQAVKISEFFGVDVARFLPWDTQTTAPKQIDWEKYKQIIKNFIKYGSDDDWKITKTKLAKLCYLLDFAWYYYNLESITWLEYMRIQQWPVPDLYFWAIEELQQEESIAV